MAKTVTKEKAKVIAPLEFPSVDVVEASAGSGKTYALAKRYVQLITSPQPKSEETPLKTILAVTFTNKATIEMKQRILEFLKKTALDAFSDSREKEDISSSISADFAKAQKIAYKMMDDIVGHYNLFQVQTIDSFVNMLLSGCSFHLGFVSNFRIKDEYRAYLEYSLDKLIDRVESDENIRKVFENFLKNYLFVENKEGWFFKQDILGLIESLYSYSNIYGGSFKIPNVNTGDIPKKKKDIVKIIGKIRDNIPDTTNGRFIKSINSFLANNRKGFDINKLPSYFGYGEFPTKKGAVPPGRIAKLWNDLRRNFGELSELESFASFKPYIEIFTLAMDDFKKLTGTEDVIFLQELNTHARNLMGESGVTVPEVYYRLATRFRHYLIDEFQDTSRLQWKNMLPLVDEALSSGGTLFYVGDKKQAIYRFRGGDVTLFDSVQEDFENYNTKQRVLTMNFRSQREIVEFNNEIFSAGNLRRFINDTDASQKNSIELSARDIDKVLNVFSDSRQEWKEENNYGYVNVKSLGAVTVDERDALMHGELVSLVKKLKERFSYGDIAILVRENKDVKLFTSWLIEDNIPVESEKTLNIREHPLIKEMVSFLKFLNSPIDNLSFASFITGDIFGRASGLNRETIQDFLFKLRIRGKKEHGTYLYTEFRKSFPEVWNNLIEKFFKSVGFIPLYELVISVFGVFEVMENFPDYQGFFMRLLELIKEKEGDYPVVSKFLDHFEEMSEKDLFVNVKHADSVTIMTIHKAKGLEFPVVIVPFLEIDISVGLGVTGSRKPYVVRQSGGNALELAQLRKAYIPYSKKLESEYREEHVKSLIDELNSLYVALTRAKYELYIYIPQRTSNKSNIARKLIPYETHERGTMREYEEGHAKEDRPLMKLPASKYSDWIGTLKSEFIEHSQLINRDKLQKGDVFHNILSFIGNLALEDKNKALNAAKKRMKLFFPYVRNLDDHFSIIKRLLADDALKEFFYVKDGSVFQEKEVIDFFGDTKRIDRLIVSSKEVRIVDYKSSRDDIDSYKKQILEYMNIVKQLYPSRNVKGFLIFLDTIKAEEIRE
jgi:ATP-dependent exoDNAse (exonuclease V) beta subunit